MKNFYKNLTIYLQARAELAKMDIQDTATKIIFLVVQFTILGFLALLAIIFLLLGLIFYLNHLTGSAFAGFFILAGFISFLILTYFVLQKVVIKLLIRLVKVITRFVSKFLFSKNLLDDD
ncbi:MAG: phage holin family protein [Microscillaceae bacterium]|nr:phage holin family protein [Microscillaceae bacterium]MDW8460237.1 phage holin family protein [Cytophagales bacterium]